MSRRPPHHRHATPRTVLVLTLLWPGWVAGAVYRCQGADGIPRFTQFPCGRQAALVLEELQTVRIPALSDAEQRLLDDLEQRRREARQRRGRTRAAADRKAARVRAGREARCRAADQALADLARQRRKGYTLQQARELDRREAELEAKARANC